MKKLILITCLLIALLGMARNVVAAPLGYGINTNKELHEIDSGTGVTTFIGNLIDKATGNTITLQGIAIDQNGNLYGLDKSTVVATLIGNTGLGNIKGLDFNDTTLLASDFDIVPSPKLRKYTVLTQQLPERERQS